MKEKCREIRAWTLFSILYVVFFLFSSVILETTLAMSTLPTPYQLLAHLLFATWSLAVRNGDLGTKTRTGPSSVKDGPELTPTPTMTDNQHSDIGYFRFCVTWSQKKEEKITKKTLIHPFTSPLSFSQSRWHLKNRTSKGNICWSIKWTFLRSR